MSTLFIGVPTLNRPHFIRETLESLLRQSFQDFRIVVSDDCSEVEAVSRVRDYIDSLNDDRISFNQLPKKGGEYGQGWYFFKEARGCQYFMILHDDDLLTAENYLERAIDTLDGDESLSLFVANPVIMDENGVPSEEQTVQYFTSQGRVDKPDGVFDVLRGHLECGFTPVCGTVFRFSALEDSGFVDKDIEGISPFEPNIFIRLGEQNAQAWFCSDQLIGFRFHSQSSRVYHHLLENPLVIDGMIKLYGSRQFTGANEKRRKVILSRWYRAFMMVHLKSGNNQQARRYMLRALSTNLLSVKAWGLAPWVFVLPGLLKKLLPPLPEARNAPQYTSSEANEVAN